MKKMIGSKGVWSSPCRIGILPLFPKPQAGSRFSFQKLVEPFPANTADSHVIHSGKRWVFSAAAVLFFVCGFFGCSLFADDTTCKISALSLEGTIDGLCLAGYKDGKLDVTIKLPAVSSRFRSPDIEYHGPSEIFLFQGEPPKSFDEKAASGSALLPSGPGHILLAILPVKDPQGRARYDTLAMDDTEKRFPMGSFLFASLAKRDLGGKLDETPFDVAAGQSVVVRPEMAKGKGFNMFLFNSSEPERPILQEAWYYLPDARVIAVLSDGPGNPPSLLCKTVSESKPAAGATKSGKQSKP